MKKLLILLLLPLFSFSQTFDELMTINSEDTFKKVVIENDYVFYSEKDDAINYTFGLVGYKAQIWATYSKDTKRVSFRFKKEGVVGHKPQFKEITGNIKSKCQYVRIDGGTHPLDREATVYKCSESGKEIGFYTSDGTGFVILML